MNGLAAWGLALPFVGTALGAGCVLFMRRQLGQGVQRALAGFAAGVMTAASVWSLLIPAIEQAEAAGLGVWAFGPAAGGFWLGVLFLLLLDRLIPHLHQRAARPEGPPARLPRITMMLLAVTLHNIPEGMAVGVVWAAVLAGEAGAPAIAAAEAMALSVGIAIQNFPEGAIVSLPLRRGGGPLRAGRRRARSSRWPPSSPSWRPGWWCRRCPGCCPSRRGRCCTWWWRNWSPKWPKASTRTRAPWPLPWALP